MKPCRLNVLVVVLLVLAVAPRAWAGPYGDSLGKCLVSSTTAAEKTTLVRWMFAMMALHPDVEKSSAVTPDQRAEISKEMARLFERLVTQTCLKETREAVRYEGAQTIETSFSLLGQVAARELFAHPKVVAGMAEFSKYLDEKKIEAAAQPAETPEPPKEGSSAK
jgi:hypothetical protein